MKLSFFSFLETSDHPVEIYSDIHLLIWDVEVNQLCEHDITEHFCTNSVYNIVQFSFHNVVYFGMCIINISLRYCSYLVLTAWVATTNVTIFMKTIVMKVLWDVFKNPTSYRFHSPIKNSIRLAEPS